MTDWEIRIDNEFATKVLSGTIESVPPAIRDVPASSDLCLVCREFRDGIWNPAFSKIYGVSELEAKSTTCALCRLFWRTCQRHKVTKLTNVMFERAGSFLRMNGVAGQGLSIFRSPSKFFCGRCL